MADLTGMTSEILARRPVVSTETDRKDAKLRQACADFESIFIYFVLKSARKSIPENGLVDSSHESEIYKSMLDEQMAQSVAKGGGMGLGQLLYEKLTDQVAKQYDKISGAESSTLASQHFIR